MPDITIQNLRVAPSLGPRVPTYLDAYPRSNFLLNDADRTSVTEQSPNTGGAYFKRMSLTLESTLYYGAADFTLPSTTDSPDNPNGARWGLAVKDANGRFMYWLALGPGTSEAFALDHTDATQDAEDIRAYNNSSFPTVSVDRTVDNLTVNETLAVGGAATFGAGLAVAGRITATGGVGGLLFADVTAALGYTPRDAAASTVNTFNGRQGAVTLISSDLNGLSLAGTTGLGSGTGGVINTGSTTIGGDSDANGVGVIDLQTRGISRWQVSNAGMLQGLGNSGIQIGQVGIDENPELVLSSLHPTGKWRLRADSQVLNSVRDDVLKFGFNVQGEDASEHVLYTQFEVNFKDVAADSNVMEYWLGYFGPGFTNGRRPFQFNVYRQGANAHKVEGNFAGSMIFRNSTQSTTSLQIEDGGNVIVHGTTADLRNNINGAKFLKQISTDNTTYKTLAYLNTFNVVSLNPDSGTSGIGFGGRAFFGYGDDQAVPGAAAVTFAGTHALTSGFTQGLNLIPTIEPVVASEVSILETFANVTAPASLVTPSVANLRLYAPTITLGAGASVTNAYNLYIHGAPSVGTNKWALYVNGGNSHFGGDAAFAASKGPVLRSPDGTCYRLVVANGGALSTTAITCP